MISPSDDSNVLHCTPSYQPPIISVHDDYLQVVWIVEPGRIHCLVIHNGIAWPEIVASVLKTLHRTSIAPKRGTHADGMRATATCFRLQPSASTRSTTLCQARQRVPGGVVVPMSRATASRKSVCHRSVMTRELLAAGLSSLAPRTPSGSRAGACTAPITSMAEESWSGSPERPLKERPK